MLNGNGVISLCSPLYLNPTKDKEMTKMRNTKEGRQKWWGNGSANRAEIEGYSIVVFRNKRIWRRIGNWFVPFLVAMFILI